MDKIFMYICREIINSGNGTLIESNLDLISKCIRGDKK